MNRRGFLRFLGLAPAVLPIAAASVHAIPPGITGSGMLGEYISGTSEFIAPAQSSTIVLVELSKSSLQALDILKAELERMQSLGIRCNTDDAQTWFYPEDVALASRDSAMEQGVAS